jgi:hypothetical protein
LDIHIFNSYHNWGFISIMNSCIADFCVIPIRLESKNNKPFIRNHYTYFMVSQKDHASKNKYKYILAVDDDSDIVTLIEHALKRHRSKYLLLLMGKNGLSVLADLGAYPHKSMYDDLVDYELSLPTTYDDVALKGFCLYHQKDFEKFSDEQKQKLVEHHSKTIKIIQAQ